MKRALITGINGQSGSYLAEFLIDKGYDVETDEQIWGSYNGHFEFDRK